MSHKSVPQECPTRVSYKSVPQECPTRVSHKSFLQEWPTRVCYKSVLQSVPQECPTRVSFGHISFSIVFAFGFVGDGFSRRTRHLSIAFNFIQRLLCHGVMEIVRVSTKVQIADLFTKITDQNTTMELPKLLGFVETDRPEEWQNTQNKPGKKSSHVVASLSAEEVPSVFDRCVELEALLKQHVSVVVLLEICTDRKSGFSNCIYEPFARKSSSCFKSPKTMTPRSVVQIS